MLHTRRLLQVFLYLTIVVAGIVLGPLLVHSLDLALAPTPALAVAPAQDAPTGDDAAMATHACHIQNVAVFDNRVHVQCWNGAGAIVFFAAPTSDAVRANRMLSVLLTAAAAGKMVDVGYTPTANGSAFGCSVANCRPIDHVSLLD